MWHLQGACFGSEIVTISVCEDGSVLFGLILLPVIGHTPFTGLNGHIGHTPFTGISRHIGHTSFTKIDEVACLSLKVSEEHEIRRHKNIFKYDYIWSVAVYVSKFNLYRDGHTRMCVSHVNIETA